LLGQSSAGTLAKDGEKGCQWGRTLKATSLYFIHPKSSKELFNHTSKMPFGIMQTCEIFSNFFSCKCKNNFDIVVIFQEEHLLDGSN